ncbi:hypothetical protein BDW69DRAFT_183597 [Aspergillus filifer]
MSRRRFAAATGRYTVSPVLLPHIKIGEGDLDLVDRILEPQTIASFLSFTCYGTLPNGAKTIYPLLNSELDFPVLHIDNYNGSQSNPNFNTTFTDIFTTDKRSIIHRIMTRIGSTEAPDDDRIAIITRHIYSFKHAAWSGMVPLSEQRWKEKKLDERRNFDIAVQYLSAVAAAFHYLNFDTVREDLRETFNLISAHWGGFDTLVNARRRERGKGEELVNVRAMWTEYIEALYEVMVERAHRWVLLHVNALRAPILRDLASHEPVDINTHDNFQLRLLDQLHTLTEIMAVADYTIFMPMQGYWGYNAPTNPLGRGVPSALRSAKHEDRHKVYGPYMKKVTRETQTQEIRDARLRGERRERGNAAPEALRRLSMLQIRCQDRVRREMRGEAVEPVPREPWVLEAMRAVGLPEKDLEEGDDGEDEGETGTPRGSGFIIYRLTYGQTEAEWDAFVKKLEAHSGDWGRGQTGSSVLKPHLKLHWRYGQKLGIAEGDIDAAKEHYRETCNQDNDTPFDLDHGVNEHAFLAVDKASYDSYTTTTYTYKYNTFFATIPPGDTTGFVLAIDPEYDLEEGPERDDEIPGFLGHLRVLGSLIWGDLYAMLVSQSTLLQDLWPLAIDHPDYVYTGPVVPLVQDAWKLHNGIRGALMRGVCSFAKAKMEGREYTPRPWTSFTSRRGQTEFQRTANPTTNPTTRATAQPSSSTAADEPSLFEEPDPEPEPSPINEALRTYMLSEFARYLRRRGQHRRAIFAEELMRAGHGNVPDMDAVLRRAEREGAEDAEPPLPEPPAPEPGDDPCPMQ